MMINDGGYESVTEFYAGRTIFITGGSGFLGKVFIEKLLYSCPKINRIYVLIREKHNLSPTNRIQKLIDNVIFTRLKETRPGDLKKIVPIVGDITAPNLGINEEDEQKLLKEVSVVIHSAATIKFNERLKVALAINLEGTKKVLELCKRMKNIKVFVYVSTAYTNTDKKITEEVVYPPPAQLDEVYEFIKLYGDDEKQTMKILNGRPNTYIFTKALTETYVKENHGEIPTVIIRPSIVSPAMNEPLKGWIDNWFGSTTNLHFVGKGFWRCLYSTEFNIIDMIPVDYVFNLTLVAAAKCNRSKDVVVFNSSSSSANPLTYRQVINKTIKVCVELGYNDLPYPCVLITKRKWLLYIITLFTLTIPAYIADFWLFLRRKPAKFVKIVTLLTTVRSAFDYFTSNSWIFKTDGTQALFASLSAADREMYPFDVTDIDWDTYVYTYHMGINKYLLKSKK